MLNHWTFMCIDKSIVSKNFKMFPLEPKSALSGALDANGIFFPQKRFKQLQ